MKSDITHPLRSARKTLGRWYNRGRVATFQAALLEILQSHKNVQPTIIFPPSLDWRRQLFQRPQQLAVALANQGALVFYIQSKKDSQSNPFEAIQNRLYLCNVPVEVFNSLDRPTIYLLTWNDQYLGFFKSPKVIYDVVDEIEAFEGNQKELLRSHQKLVGTADLILTTAGSLYKQIKSDRPDALLCPNGVDLEHFSHLRVLDSGLPPEDLQSILATGRPVIGYHGALAQWFDYDLMRSITTDRPDLSFVILGPDYYHTLPNDLLKLANFYWLGIKPYEELPAYLRCFDVGIIPFQVNKITHATSPIKLFEYMAAGKPIVITPMHESMQYEGTLIASDSKEFSTQLNLALSLRNDPGYLNTIDHVARENTWDIRAQQILLALGRA